MTFKGDQKLVSWQLRAFVALNILTTDEKKCEG